jgi:hypothetical protein
MSGPGFDPCDREDWDENDWERFLRRADARTAKYQELFETLIHHPRRDMLIAREMGWQEDVRDCGGDPNHCPDCPKREMCEAYEMSRLMMEPGEIEDDPDAADLISSFDQLREIDAYLQSHDFAVHLEDCVAKRFPGWLDDEEARATIFAAQMVPAQIAGGHGIGYGRDSLCGNIANCKRAMSSLKNCVDHLRRLQHRGLLVGGEMAALDENAEGVAREIDRWIEDLRARVWWR